MDDVLRVIYLYKQIFSELQKHFLMVSKLQFISEPDNTFFKFHKIKNKHIYS